MKGSAGGGDHPAGTVPYEAAPPSVGTCALCFDYQVDGAVRTATTTMEVA